MIVLLVMFGNIPSSKTMRIPMHPTSLLPSNILKTNQRNLASCMEGTLEYASLVLPQRNEPVEVVEQDLVTAPIGFDFKKLNEWLPAQITPDENGNEVLHKIADKGVQSFLASDNFKSSTLGRLNEKVKEETKMEVNIRSSNKISHKFSANLEPFQQGAKLSYAGLIGVELSFYSLNKTQTLKVMETFFNKKFYYENNMNVMDRTDHLGVQWDW